MKSRATNYLRRFCRIRFYSKRIGNAPSETDDLFIRIPHIEVNPAYVSKYLSILKKEAEATTRLEALREGHRPYFKKSSSEIRILVIYASKSAHETHPLTPHFILRKTTSLEMAKPPMETIDSETMG